MPYDKPEWERTFTAEMLRLGADPLLVEIDPLYLCGFSPTRAAEVEAFKQGCDFELTEAA